MGLSKLLRRPRHRYRRWTLRRRRPEHRGWTAAELAALHVSAEELARRKAQVFAGVARSGTGWPT